MFVRVVVALTSFVNLFVLPLSLNFNSLQYFKCATVEPL